MLGERVRYDGRSKPAEDLVAWLQGWAELVPVCPEVEAGFGVPREPIEVLATGRVVGVTSRQDRTGPLLAVARRVAALELHGAVLQAKSPSCGVGSTPVVGGDGPGDGVFAAALQGRMPLADRFGLAADDARAAFRAAAEATASAS